MNWFTSKGEFKELSQDELGKLEASQLGAYHSAKSENDKAKAEAMFKGSSHEMLVKEYRNNRNLGVIR